MKNPETLATLDTRHRRKAIKPKKHRTLKHIQSSNSVRWDVLGHTSSLAPPLLKSMYLI